MQMLLILTRLLLLLFFSSLLKLIWNPLLLLNAFCMLKSDFMVVFIFSCKIEQRESEYFWSFIVECCGDSWHRLTDYPAHDRKELRGSVLFLISQMWLIYVSLFPSVSNYSVRSRNAEEHQSTDRSPLHCPSTSKTHTDTVWNVWEASETEILYFGSGLSFLSAEASWMKSIIVTRRHFLDLMVVWSRGFI